MMSAIFSQRNFLLKIYLISLTVIGLYFVLAPWLQPRTDKVLLLAVLGSAFVAGYVFTLKTKRLAISAHFYTIGLYITLVANATITGGIGAPGIVWFVLCPLLAFLTLSTKSARLWLMVILVTVFAFYAFENIVVVQQYAPGKTWYFVSYLLFFPTLYAILKAFRIEVSKRNLALTTLNQRLEVERKMLRESQEELVQKSERLEAAEAKALERSAKLSFYLDQLIDIKRMEELHSGSLAYSLKSVAQFLIKAMNVDNVSIWSTEKSNDSLQLLLSSGNTITVSQHETLHRQEIVDAFDMLASGAIVVDSVQSRESHQLKAILRCSAETMTSCPFFIEGKFAGFISCQTAQRQWCQEDLIFLRAVSDTIPLAFKSHARRMQQQLLEEKQREITEINNSLEKKVNERTALLNERNRQLTDFAFTNAHHIRGPICRLQGLQNLLTISKDSAEILKIAEYMCISVDELDNITRKTSAELNKIIDN
jgi:hypothetical protein